MAKRPEGGRLLRDAVTRRFDAVLVYNVDRLGREAIDVMTTKRLLVSLDLRLMTVATGEPDLLGYDVQAVVSDYYRRKFLQDASNGMARAAREGRYTGGIVPYGFRVEGYKQTARLVPDETPVIEGVTAAGVVRRIYDRLGLGQVSCAVVADELNALGVPTHYARDGRGIRGKRTRGLWTAGRIRNLVTNPVYAGDLQYGRRTKRRDKAVIGADIEGLVSPALWNAAQETLARNRLAAKNTRRVYILRGVIHCPVCGLTYVGSQGRTGASWYRCGGTRRDRGPLVGKCSGPFVRGETLEPIIWADIKRWLRNPGEILDELAQERDGGAAAAEAEAITIRRALEGLAEQKATAIRLVVTGRLAESEIEPELERIKAEQSRLEARLAATDGPGAAAAPELATDLLSDVRARLDAGLSDDQRQEIVRLLVGRIVVERIPDQNTNRVTVEYRFPGVVQTLTGTGSSPRRAGSGPAGRAPGRPGRSRPGLPRVAGGVPPGRPAQTPAAHRGRARPGGPG
jgi:site-specific DNA recombinase